MYRMEMTLNKITFQINPALIDEFIGQEKKNTKISNRIQCETKIKHIET